LPLIKVEIDGDIYPIVIDLGSKFSLSLDKKTLTKLNKKNHGVVEWRDLKGNYYHSNAYILPKIQVGDLAWNDVIANEELEDFLSNTTLWNTHETIPNDKVGYLGRPLLLRYKLLIDVANSLLVISNDQNKLSEMGYEIKKMIKVPLEEGAGIILKVETDIGIQKYGIDTGATINLARASLFSDKEQGQDKGMRTYSSQRCVIGDHDFKKTMFYLIDITPELKDIDGCLGMDFLKNHVVYIDYPNRTAYIADPSNNSTHFIEILSSTSYGKR
jgi:hypothetical protein